MGLLDQVLGQVIGNMAGGSQARPSGAPSGGGSGANPMGDILGQILAGGRGGSPQAGGGGLGDLLGQVLGGAQGGAAGRAPAPGGGGGLGDLLGQVLGGGGQGAPAPGGQAPAPSPAPSSGGGLGGILGGAGSNLSPLVLAVLAVLASKHLSSGAGGFGTILHDMFGGGRKPADDQDGPQGSSGPAGGDEPSYNPDDVEDGYGDPRDGPGGRGGPSFDPRGDAGRGGGGRGGGFLDDVGSMLDGPGGAARQAPGGQGGGLGDLLGGGFDGLRQRFDQNGQGGLIDSWIGHGSNQQPSSGDLEQALGSGTVDQLARQFGIDRNELLQQLSRALPQVVDGLTPNGRAPTQQERSSWI